MYKLTRISNPLRSGLGVLLLALVPVVLLLSGAVACSMDDVPPADAISADTAKQIALDHAGLSAAEVQMDRAEYDLDDGVPEYEIKFRQGRKEYEYRIHAITGEVLTHHSEDDRDE